MSNHPPLLPSNASDLEHDLDGASARIGAVPVPLRNLWDPDAAQMDVLPWLAWAWSIDFWDDNWSERQKRAAIENAYELHRRKGTIHGLRDVIRLTGGRLVRAVLPPAKTFAAPRWTKAERREWRARHPELRVYDHRDRGSRAGAMVLPAGGAANAKSYLAGGTLNGTAFPARGTAFARIQPQGYIVQPDGTERPLTTVVQSYDTAITQVVTYARGKVQKEGWGTPVYRFSRDKFRGWGAMLSKPEAGGPATSKLFPAGRRNFLADTRARERFYTTRLRHDTEVQTRTLSRHTVQPTLDPIDVQADAVAARGIKAGTCLGAAYPGRVPGAPRPTEFVADVYAEARMYRRTHLFDPSVTLEAQGRTFHLGAMRLGMPAYHGEITVAMRGRRHVWQANRSVGGYLVAHSPDAFRRTYRALRWAVPTRDKILVQTTTHAPIRASGNILAGQHKAGAWQEV